MTRNKTILLLLILGAVVVSYSNTLHGEFQFDDDLYISENSPIKNPAELFQTNILGQLSSGNRLLTMLTFSFNYAIGGLNVEGYHTVNIIIHLIVILLVYSFLRRILLVPEVNESLGGRAGWIALITTAIFALHPIQTEAVTYIIQRAESLTSLFYLLCLSFLIKFTETRGWRSSAFWVLGMVSFAAGWGAKEVIVTVPAMFIFYILFFMNREKLKKAALGIAPFVLMGVVLGIKEVAGFGASTDAGFSIKGLGQPGYLFTEMRVLLTYLRLIFLPIHQNLDYDYPIYRNFFDLNTAGSMLLWIVVACLSFYALRVKGRWKWHCRLMGFGMLWFLIILIPTSSLVPLKDVIYEHRVYLAMTGVVLAGLTTGDLALRQAVKAMRVKMAAVAIPVVLMLAALSIFTYERNEVWRSRLTLWMDVLGKSPLKSRPQNNVGNCYYIAGNYYPALWHYLEAIRIDPENTEAYYNSAITYETLGRKREAIFYYTKFIEKAPEGYRSLAIYAKKKIESADKTGQY